MAVNLFAAPADVTMPRVFAFAFAGTFFYAVAQVVGTLVSDVLPYAYGAAPLEEEGDEEVVIEEAAPLSTRDRLIVGGQMVSIPEELRGPVNEIVELRAAGQLERISARELERRRIASRETGQAQQTMDWLEGAGLVVQKPYQPAEWTDPPSPESIPIF
jgi:hypothetical protein